jgi:putative sporulation protein YyaC
MNKSISVTPPAPLFRDSYQSDTLNERLSYLIYSTLLPKVKFYDIVVVCIGTDRSTGDALGPIIGSKLTKLYPKNMTVYGTLDDPVHAMNLEETLVQIKTIHRLPYIIAIDACLGELKSVGMITMAQGPLKPGAGVQKSLPDVGDIHMTGIVNVGGFMEYFVLQNTRLSIVMRMADKIASALYYASIHLNKKIGSPQQRELPL